MEWDEFDRQFVWRLDTDCRHKTAVALRMFAGKCPDDVLRPLQRVRVMAPSGVYGNAFDGMGYIYIYLDPCLELQPQKNVEFTVAHEFAHVVLNHTDYLRTGEKEKEADADALAKAWGFTRPTG
jgi:hypothetical protein